MLRVGSLLRSGGCRMLQQGSVVASWRGASRARLRCEKSGVVPHGRHHEKPESRSSNPSMNFEEVEDRDILQVGQARCIYRSQRVGSSMYYK